MPSLVFAPGAGVLGMQTIDDKTKSLSINPEYRKEVAILKELTWTYVIEAPTLAMQREGQKRIIGCLFEVYKTASQTKKKLSLFFAIL